MKTQNEPWLYLGNINIARATLVVAAATAHSVLVAGSAGQRIQVLELEYIGVPDPTQTGAGVAELEAGVANTVLHHWGFNATKYDTVSGTAETQPGNQQYLNQRGFQLGDGDDLKISNTGDKHPFIINIVYRKVPS